MGKQSGKPLALVQPGGLLYNKAPHDSDCLKKFYGWRRIKEGLSGPTGDPNLKQGKSNGKLKGNSCWQHL